MKVLKYTRVIHVDGTVEESFSVPVSKKKLKQSTLRGLIEKLVEAISRGGGSQPPMLPPSRN